MELAVLLLARIFAAQGTKRLVALLQKIKEEKDLPRNAFRTTGTKEQLETAANAAIVDGHLTAADLAALVDELEENGGQHVFLFDLTEDGLEALTKEALRDAYPSAAATPALYGNTPTRRTFFVDRGDEGFGVKQVFTAEYWELDETRSRDGAEERVRVHVKRYRRAVNLMLVRPGALEVEFRLDRVRSQQDDSLATQHFELFEASLAKVLTRDEHLEPVRFTPSSLAKMAAAKTETYMSVDEATDGEISQRISNTREKTKGIDVRDHEAYSLAKEGYARESLNIYWRDDDDKIHTILSNVPLLETDESVDEEDMGGKVYIAAKLHPEQLRHVLGRIRHFAQ